MAATAAVSLEPTESFNPDSFSSCAVRFCSVKSHKQITRTNEDLRLNGEIGGAQDNFLYRNNGDGTFTRVTDGSVVNDGGVSLGCGWGDYTNNGFLDLFVGNGWVVGNHPNFLYRNNGNDNAWLRVRSVGTVSNRSAIGAKLRVLATIGGQSLWQLRHINTGDGFSGNELDAHFGLGDATHVEVLRIEWPSGIVQEFRDVPAKQLLKVTEPPRLKASHETGQFLMSLPGGKGIVYEIQSSGDLTEWTSVGLLTNVTGRLEFRNPESVSKRRGFYRAVLR